MPESPLKTPFTVEATIPATTTYRKPIKLCLV